MLIKVEEKTQERKKSAKLNSFRRGRSPNDWVRARCWTGPTEKACSRELKTRAKNRGEKAGV